MAKKDKKVAPDIGARVYNNANINTTNQNWKTLTFNSERYDTDEIHSTSVNPGRLVCKTAGVYIVVGQVRWYQHGNGDRRIQILLNGSPIAKHTHFPSNAWVFYHQVVVLVRLEVDDYLQLQAWQSSTGDLEVEYEAGISPEFMMQRINTRIGDIGVRATNDSNVIVSASTWTYMTMNDEEWDTDDFHSTVSNTSRLTIPENGKYLFMGTVRWEQDNSATQRFLRVEKNRTDIRAQVQMYPGFPSAIDYPQHVVTIFGCSAGDYVELRAMQTTAGDLDSEYNAIGHPFFIAQRLG